MTGVQTCALPIFSVLLRTLYPACPHITHALWTELGYAARLGDLLDAPWPQVDEGALAQDEIELVLQIAGKMRGAVKVPAGADKAAIEAAALASPEFAKFGEVLAKTKKKLEEASATIDSAEVRTRAMARKLKSVEQLPESQARELLQAGPEPEEGPEA